MPAIDAQRYTCSTGRPSVRATMAALANLKNPEEVARRRGKELRELFSVGQA